MAAAVRLISFRALNCHIYQCSPHSPLSLRLRNPRPRSIQHPASAGFRSTAVITGNGVGHWPAVFRAQSPLFLSISCSDLLKDGIDGSLPEPGKGFHLWDPVGELAVRHGGGEKGAIWTVVLLGWLGAEERHLKRYADIYNARGIRSVRFVVPLWEMVGLDLGQRMEAKIARFAEELANWCLESEKDGRERNLFFHTFSNTGWLVYGSILQNFQSRNDVLEKIKGCVVDSGAASEISPKVWAAGFCAALIKKRSSSVIAALEQINGDGAEGRGDRSGMQDWKSQALEIIVMFILEKIFSIILILPDVNQRLCKIISVLSKKQPPCPQLYLYSSADRVIPASSVESFIHEQKAMGRKVLHYNFGTSPHVDHVRSFPRIYSAKISEFLEECSSQIICSA
ncbi:transmembrane protein 53 [Phalaenopsis equestris]|uniref:transmembrane protein 53 n=1 Tax=Phalaenopsis equestris TaxID=78828 RepID=UPI0009E1D6E3|nr:transmembrane protein 53 [Phalaenopsis equestris]